MNQFTKEELIDIYDAVMDTSVAMFEHLPAKIQSMIDNYDKQKPAIVFVRGESRDISEFYDE